MLLLRFHGSLACVVTITATGGLIAGRNGILVESILRGSNFRVSVMPS